MIITTGYLKNISCNGCGIMLWNTMEYGSATEIRANYKKQGWKLMVGDAYKYGDYCPECLAKNKHKKQ